MKEINQYFLQEVPPNTQQQMKKIELNGYTIFIGAVATSLPEFFAPRKFSAVFIIVDDNTEKHCLPHLLPALGDRPIQVINIPSGEENKNIKTCQIIWSKLMDAGADRQALVIDLGGGVIGDMGGFCASTFKRGIQFIQVPTTLLSQVDASIGGKLGIDFHKVKNSIGVFNNPEGVFIDTSFLKTLSGREVLSGFAEIIKHSLIADYTQWELLLQYTHLQEVSWQDILPASLRVKKDIVEQDPFEKNVRKALNFGHTIGHAVEAYALESGKPLLHGEAIAIGMICESWLSHQLCSLSAPDLKIITDYLSWHYPSYHLARSVYPELLQLMRNDKKNQADRINFSLISQPGKYVVDQYAGPEMIMEALDYYGTVGR